MESYTYTDISSGFFEQAMEKFAKWGDMIEYAKSDVEQDPQIQGSFKDWKFYVISQRMSCMLLSIWIARCDMCANCFVREVNWC
jgi:hypothetical protein